MHANDFFAFVGVWLVDGFQILEYAGLYMFADEFGAGTTILLGFIIMADFKSLISFVD